MKEKKPDPKVTLFFDGLQRLDAGDRARLKRCAGQSLAEARNVLGLFFHLLPPDVPYFQQETYFLVATLYPLAEEGGQGNLGASLQQARQPNNQKGLDRRVNILLDSNESQLAFRLRQVIHFLKSSQVRIAWPLLLEDLLSWTHPSRPVQRRWAQTYYSEQPVR